MLESRSALAGCALVLAGVAPAASADAEPHHPVVVSEDAADFTPTLEPDSVQPRPTTYAIARSEDAILLAVRLKRSETQAAPLSPARTLWRLIRTQARWTRLRRTSIARFSRSRWTAPPSTSEAPSPRSMESLARVSPSST
jgi:hypothetical protein